MSDFTRYEIMLGSKLLRPELTVTLPPGDYSFLLKSGYYDPLPLWPALLPVIGAAMGAVIGPLVALALGFHP